MSKQITNMIDAGVAYEHIIRVIERLHRAIKVVVTEKPWQQKTTTTVIMVESQAGANQVQRFLCEEIGGKEITIKLSQI